MHPSTFALRVLDRRVMSVRFQPWLRRALVGLFGDDLAFRQVTLGRLALLVAHVPNGAGGIQSMKIGYTNIHPETVHVRTKGANEFAQYFSSP